MAKKTKQEAQQERLSLAEKRNRQERRNKKSRKEREQEKRRKKQERDRRKQKNIPTTAQQSIPYIRMLQDGICQVTKTFFSKTIQFYDINYQLALNEDKTTIFENYCDFLNYFDSSISVQLSFINQQVDVAEFEKSIDIPDQNDDFNAIREEYRTMLKNQLSKGNNGLVKTKYITFGIEAESLKVARPRLERIETDILNNFKILGAQAHSLNGLERLEILYHVFNQDRIEPFKFQYKMLPETGLKTKDFIAPTSFNFSKNQTFLMGRTMGSVSYLQILAPELTDRMLADFLDVDDSINVNIHIQSIDQSSAIKMIKSKISDLDKMKIEEQKRAVRSGYDMDVLPSDLVTYGEEAKNLLEDLQSRNERMFLVTVLVMNTAKKRQKLDNNIFQVQGIAQKYNCSVDVIPSLDGTGAEYYFTDLSAFFLNNAREKFSGYEWVKYNIFDINKDIMEQTIAPFSVDIILAANVLHNAKNIHYVLENLKKLLKPNGTIIILEETLEAYTLLTSMEFKDGLTGFTDERAENNQTFFKREQWEGVFKEHKADIVYQFPEKGTPLEMAGQTIYVVRFKENYICPDKNNMLDELERRIPEYMIPSVITFLPRLPQTSNDKIDRGRISKWISASAEENKKVDVAELPQNDLEEQIARIWCKELNIERIGRNDNFYLSGGDSLLIAQVIARMRETIEAAKRWSWDDLLKEMMKTPTIRGVAKILSNQAGENEQDKSLVIIKEAAESSEKKVTVVFHAGTGTLTPYNSLIAYITERSQESSRVRILPDYTGTGGTPQ